jgi:hypothetical protein
LNSILRRELLEMESSLPPVDQISLLPSSPAPTLRDQVSFTPDNIPEITPEISTPDIHPALEIPEVTPDKEDTTETAKVLSGYRLVSNNALGCLLQNIFRLGQQNSSPDATLELQSTTKIGFASRETYGTTQGEHEVMFDSCESVKSDIVPTDKKYSRFQPTLNLSIPAAARIAGISLEKLDEFLAIVGVQAPAPKNLVESMKKVELAIKQEANEQLRKNRIGHNAATRELPDYNKELDDIVWNDPLTNEVHTTTSSMGSIDGAGATRAYNHLMTGTQSAVCVMSGVTGKPIYLHVDRTACMLCTRVMHQAIRDKKDPRAFIGQHEGECSRTSKNSPAVAEEFALASTGTRLLVDESGKYRGDEEAVFLKIVIRDGDSKGANRLIQSQVDVIGSPAAGRAVGEPDHGHVTKNLVKALYKVQKEHRSMKGKGGLENERIAAIVGDVKKCVKWLSIEIKDIATDIDTTIYVSGKVAECLKMLAAIVPHHCADHSKCISRERCTYLRVRYESPVWSKIGPLPRSETKELMCKCAAEARFGYYMLLNEDGKFNVTKEIQKRFNIKTLVSLAKRYSSNRAELLWSGAVKHSEGKRINQNYSGAWENSIGLSAMKISIDDTATTILRPLKTTGSEVQEIALRRRLERAEKKKRVKISDKSTETRKNLKQVKKTLNNTKNTPRCTHKSELIAADDKGKASIIVVAVEVSKKRKGRICTKCQMPHSGRFCPFPTKNLTKRQRGGDEVSCWEVVFM